MYLQHNIERRVRANNVAAKRSKYCIVRVFVALRIRHAMRMRHTESTEVKSLKWSEKLSNVEGSEMQ